MARFVHWVIEPRMPAIRLMNRSSALVTRREGVASVTAAEAAAQFTKADRIRRIRGLAQVVDSGFFAKANCQPPFVPASFRTRGEEANCESGKEARAGWRRVRGPRAAITSSARPRHYTESPNTTVLCGQSGCLAQPLMTARSRSWWESRTAAKQKGCSFQETGRSMFAVPTMGPLAVTNIKLTNEPGGSSESGMMRPPVRETHRSFPETRCPSRQRRTMGVSSASRNRGERLSGSTWGSRVISQSIMFGVLE